MAIVNPPAWLQNSGATNTAQLIRIGAGSSVKGPTVGSPNTISGKGGVVIRPGTGGSLAVTQNGGGNMSVNVASGCCYVRGTENVYQGGHWVLNDASVNLAVTASDPTNARTDSVYIAVRDSFYSGVNNDSVLAVAAGNPATPTTPPTLPVNSLELYRINVRAATTSILTSDLTDRRPWLTALGGISLPRSFEATDAGVIDGDTSYISPTGLRFWDSGAAVWRAYPHFVSTVTDITNNATPKTNQITYDTSLSFWYKWNGSSWLPANMPAGILSRGRRVTASSTTTSEIGVLRLDDVPIAPGRCYEIKTTPLFMDSSVVNDEIFCRIRATFDSSTPTTASTVLSGTFVDVRQTDAALAESKTIITTYNPAGSETLSLLLCVGRIAGTGSVSVTADNAIEMTIVDIGPDPGNTGTAI